MAWFLMLAPVLLITGYLVVYSYLEFKKEGEGIVPSPHS
jgi:hypothetical protein